MVATIILLSLMFLGTGYELAKHGEHKTGKHNFWAKLCADAIMLTLYYFASLFDNF